MVERLAKCVPNFSFFGVIELGKYFGFINYGLIAINNTYTLLCRSLVHKTNDSFSSIAMVAILLVVH